MGAVVENTNGMMNDAEVEGWLVESNEIDIIDSASES